MSRIRNKTSKAMQTKQLKRLPSHRSTKRTRAMTLPEMMVAVAIGTMVLLGIVTIFMTSSVSFEAMGNYITMDLNSRQVMDQMSRDIRQSKNLVSYRNDSTAKSLAFDLDGAGTRLIYMWDPSEQKLSQWKTGEGSTMLLTNCVSFDFTVYDQVARTNGAGVYFNTAPSVEATKSVEISWKCSKTILGKTITSEDMQQARIVIRNKPLS